MLMGCVASASPLLDLSKDAVYDGITYTAETGLFTGSIYYQSQNKVQSNTSITLNLTDLNSFFTNNAEQVITLVNVNMDTDVSLVASASGLEVYQGGALFDSLSVLENVMFPLNLFSDMSEKEKRERAIFCLHRVDLKNAENLSPAEISGGMKKRVAIARAIVLQPKFLFCDEPNSGLDPLTSIVIDNLISELTHEYGMTTVVNTHDMNSVFEIGEHIVFIHEGEKAWEGNKEEIGHTDNKYLNEFIFSSKLYKKIKGNI
jgi:ABC-type transporter Mla maintaining outer membrane lipid asymmetry ATPase subunit MlaF